VSARSVLFVRALSVAGLPTGYLPKSEAGLLESEDRLNLFRCWAAISAVALNHGHLFAAFQPSPASFENQRQQGFP